MKFHHPLLVRIVHAVLAPTERAVADLAIAPARGSQDRRTAQHGSGWRGAVPVDATGLRWPTTGRIGHSVLRNAGWRHIPTAVLLAVVVLAAALIAFVCVSDGLWPAETGNSSREVAPMVGVRVLPQSGWRLRDESGSVAGETPERDSGEPADETTAPATWSDAIH